MEVACGEHGDNVHKLMSAVKSGGCAAWNSKVINLSSSSDINLQSMLKLLFECLLSIL